MKLVFDCKQMARLISDGHDSELPAAERARYRLHLVMCQSCRTAKEQMDFLRQAMKDLQDRRG